MLGSGLGWHPELGIWVKPGVLPASSAWGCPRGLDAEGQHLPGTLGFASFGKRNFQSYKKPGGDVIKALC